MALGSQLGRKTALVIVALLVLGACASTFQETVDHHYKGIPPTLLISPESCEDFEPLPRESGSPRPNRVLAVLDNRQDPTLLGHKLGHALEEKLYQNEEYPLDRALADGVDRVLSSIPSDLPIAVELTLGDAWVDSFSIAKATDVKAPVKARFAFVAELELGDPPAVFTSTFKGEVSHRYWQAKVENHQSTLNEAFCDALGSFRSWVRESITVPGDGSAANAPDSYPPER